MKTLPITLIVKAPNQQIEDQIVKCELSWSINKLKQHLSEVYPNRPAKHEQKLIYSGQLLRDSVTLRDVLRHYDSEEVHTVHLVCTRVPPKPPQKPKLDDSESTVTAQPMTANTQQPPLQPQQQQSMPTVTPDTSDANLPWTQTNNVAQMDPNQYAMHMAWMQQTYMQYMMQYMQLANSYGQGVGAPAPEAPQPPAQNVAPEQPAVPLRDPDNLERDWLDVFYMMSRMMILITVVYFYSSPLRFVFVLMLAIAFYLYHIGFFRLNNNNNINNNNNVTAEPGAQQDQQQQQQQQRHAPTRLMVVWTFFATFFASLIPEIPNAV